MVKNNKQKCAIYARQSSGLEVESKSTIYQVEMCKKIAEECELEIVLVEIDNNSSGSTYPVGAEHIASGDISLNDWFESRNITPYYRHGLGNIMSRLNEIDYLIVYDTTRLYRAVTRSFLGAYLETLLTKNNVKILAYKGGEYDLNEFADTLTLSVQNCINDNQIKVTAEKGKAALRKLKDSGIYPTCPKMYGIIYHAGKDKIVTVDESKKEVIQYIFNRLEEGIPRNRICREINEKFPGRTDGKGFYDSHIDHIVKQPFYCGKMYNSNGILIPALQMEGKAFIPVEQWLKVNEMCRRNSEKRTIRKGDIHPFKNILYCGECDAALTINIDHKNISEKVIEKQKAAWKEGDAPITTRTTSINYHCHLGAVNKGDAKCRESRITEILPKEKKDYTDLRHAVAPFLVLAQYKELEEQKLSDKFKVELLQERRELEKIEKRIEEIKVNIVTSKISTEDGSEMLSMAKKNLISISKSISKKERILEKSKHSEEDAKKYYRELDNLMNCRIPDVTYESLLQKAIKKITVFNDHIDIDSIYGQFPLPRIIKGRFRHLPKFDYSIECIDEKDKHNLLKNKIKVVYKCGNKNEELIVDLGVMKISKA
jgi:hypothetical protein